MNRPDVEPTRNKCVGLVVDDDPVSRKLVAQVVASVGLQVVEATNGIECVEAFSRSQPDIVVLDVMMPDMNGLDACAAIRATSAGARVPILMMTGLDDDEAIKQAYEVGATDFVSKPATAEMLAHRIRYMLRNANVLERLVQDR